MRNLRYISPDETAILADRDDGSQVLLEPSLGPIGDMYQLARRGSLGNIAPYQPPPPPPVERVLAELQAGISAHVNRVARGRGYDDGVSCASYAASTVPLWAAEAGAFIAWRDAVWSAVLDGLESVQSGKTPMPVLQDIIEALPVIEWPEGYSE